MQSAMKLVCVKGGPDTIVFQIEQFKLCVLPKDEIRMTVAVTYLGKPRFPVGEHIFTLICHVGGQKWKTVKVRNAPSDWLLVL